MDKSLVFQRYYSFACSDMVALLEVVWELSVTFSRSLPISPNQIQGGKILEVLEKSVATNPIFSIKQDLTTQDTVKKPTWLNEYVWRL